MEGSLFHIGIKVIELCMFHISDDFAFLTLGASFDIGFDKLMKFGAFVLSIY